MFATIAFLAVALRKSDNRSARVVSVIALEQEQYTRGARVSLLSRKR